MIINEIISVPSQSSHGINLNDLIFTRYKKASVENYPLFYSIIDHQIIFLIKDEIDIAYLVCDTISNFPKDKETIQIKRSWVDPIYRNKGIMTAIYNTLRNQHFRVISDYELSPESQAILQKLKLVADIKMYNVQTNRLVAYDDNLIFDPNIVLVMESYFLSKPANNDILKENNFFIGLDCP